MDPVIAMLVNHSLFMHIYLRQCLLDGWESLVMPRWTNIRDWQPLILIFRVPITNNIKEHESQGK